MRLNFGSVLDLKSPVIWATGLQKSHTSSNFSSVPCRFRLSIVSTIALQENYKNKFEH